MFIIKGSADHIHLLFYFTQHSSDLFAGKFVSHLLFMADDVICRGFVRSCPWVCSYFWLMTSSAAGLFVPARATVLFSVSTRSMCVCDDWTPVYWFVVCYLLCLFMPGRVSRDMGLVWFPISCLCWFVCFIRFVWSCPGVLAGTWGWCGSLFPISIDLIFFNRFGWFCVALAETKESDQFRPSFLHYNIPLSLKLINLFCPVSVTRVYPEW